MAEVAAAAIYYGCYYAFKTLASYAIKKGSDWYVDSKCVQAIEAIYKLETDGTGKKIDHRRKPWCTMRRFVQAYKTGNKDKFEELRESLRELKDSLTDDVQEQLADAVGQGGASAVRDMVQGICDMSDAMP
jgi:hypothetical protein